MSIHTYREVFKLKSSAQYEQKHKRTCGKIQESNRVLTAYVNDNRWIVDCPCESGAIVDLDIRKARCFACGTVYNVFVPSNLHEIESVLLERLPKNRHWFPHETIERLRNENRSHGLPG